MKIVAIIQARMSSNRLPGKIMADIAGKPMLFQVVSRAKRARNIDLAVVATSNGADDDPVEQFCQEAAIPCFRGNLDDVLDRFYQAARHFQAEIIVRLTADCPLLDPQVIDNVIDTYLKGDYQYVSNAITCTYPDGLDTEVFPFQALEQAWTEAKLRSEREHVTPYIRNHPEIFRLKNVSHTQDLSSLRWTVDEPKDLVFVRAVCDHFGKTLFGMKEILSLLEKDRELQGLNAGIQRNEGYLKSLSIDDLMNNEKET